MSIFRSGPFVHVAEKMPVNHLKMREVEFPFQRRFRKLKRTCRYKSSFGFFEGGFIRYAETVF